MEIIPQLIMDYAEKHSSDEPLLLAELRRETWQKVVNPRMLSGVLQGRLLAMISKLVQPTAILEIGTYTGYATLCLAEGLASDGKIITVEKNEELADFHLKYFEKSGFGRKIFCVYDDALRYLSQTKELFDLVFIDADKASYVDYYNLVIDKVRKNGIILSDNVLWSGKVVEDTPENDLDTQTIMKFNELLKNDPRIETVLLPFRDGLSFSIKR